MNRRIAADVTAESNAGVGLSRARRKGWEWADEGVVEKAATMVLDAVATAAAAAAAPNGEVVSLVCARSV
jgi:hypothetical protein